jgi:hypothetical protein
MEGKGCGRKQPLHNLIYNSEICLGGLKTTKKTPSG